MFAELFIGLFLLVIGLLAVLWLVAGPFLVFHLSKRVNELEQRIRRTDHRLTDMQKMLEKGVVAAGPQVKSAAPTEQAPQRDEASEPAALPAKPTTSEPIWLDQPEERRQPQRMPASVRKTPEQEDVPVVVEADQAFNFEEILAGRWLTWVGAIALVLGAGFFLKYAIDNEWIGETGRVVIGLVVGLGCFAGGAYAMLRHYSVLAQGLVGAAMGILFFSIFAAWDWYELIDQPVAFVAMILVTAAALSFSVYFNTQATAVLGLLGGFLTPVMLSTGVDAQWQLFSYILILDLGVLGAAGFRKWPTLQILAFLCTLMMWMGWFAQHYEPAKMIPTLILITVYFLVFALLGIWYNVLRRKPATPGDFFLILATPIMYFIALYGITRAEYAALHGLLAVLLGGTYLGFGIFALQTNPQGRQIVIALGGVAASFLTLAVPLQLTGHWIAIAWACESLLLVELGLRFQEYRLRWAGFGLLLVVQLILLDYAGATLTAPDRFTTRFPGVVRNGVQQVVIEPSWTDIFNGRSFSFLASAVVLGVLAWEYRRRKPASDETEESETQSLLFHRPDRPTAAGLVPVLLAAVPISLLVMFGVETYSLGHRFDWIFPTFVGVLSVWTVLTAVALVIMSGKLRMPLLTDTAFAVCGLLLLMVLATTFWTLGELPRQWRNLELRSTLDLWRVPVFNPRGIGLLFTILGAGVCSFLISREDDREGREPLSAILGVFAHLTGLTLLTLEFYAQGVIWEWGTATSLGITFLWTLYALATLGAGILWKSATVRILALALILVTTAKVFLYDIWYLDPTIRTLAFMGLGAALMLVSFLYRKFRVQIREWIAPLLIATTCLLAVAEPAAAQSAEPKRDIVTTLEYRWPIQLPAPELYETPNGLFRMTLPPEMYGDFQSGFSDIRILATIDDVPASREIPYVLVRPQDEETTHDRPAPLFNLSEKGMRTEFLLDLGEQPEPVNSLNIVVDSKLHNYERTVHVLGSDNRDAEEWNLLTRSAYLLDVTRPGHQLRTGSVSFPKSVFRYYRIEILNEDEPPLKITGATLAQKVSVKAPRREYETQQVRQEEDTEAKTTLAVFDTTYDRLPLVSAELEIDYDGDYYRPVTIEVADDLEEPVRWRMVSSGQLFRIQRLGDLAVSSELQFPMQFPEIQGRYLRVTVFNGDDRPLRIANCVARGIDHQLVVQAKEFPHPPPAGELIAVYVGNDSLSPPWYDLAKTSGKTLLGPAPVLTLEPREANPWYIGPIPPELPWSERNQALLWTGTLIGVVIVGAGIVLMLRQAARNPPPVE